MKPEHWYARLPVPALEQEVSPALAVTLRAYSGTAPFMDKPALTENLLCLHQGGAKRLHRWQAGRNQTWDAAPDTLSFMPMFQANRWLTEGPVAFTHLTLSSGLLACFAREEFDREPRDLAVQDRVAAADPLLARIVIALVEHTQDRHASKLYRESLLTSLIMRCLIRHSTMSAAAPPKPARGGLAGWQLRRVLDYMAAHLSQDFGVAELAALTGLSRAQFVRGFRQSTGVTPGVHLQSLRMQHAKRLLLDASNTAHQIAQSVGFSGAEPFARAFRRSIGTTPASWRRRHQTP